MKKDHIYLTHILEAINNIEEFVPDGKEQFMNSKLIQHAVIRNLEIIGEATKLISKEFRDKHPNIPWKEMAGMRDVLIHNYMGIDTMIVWNVVEKELPRIKKQINEFLE
jgi:uncharacterized protein with HEPN domain